MRFLRTLIFPLLISGCSSMSSRPISTDAASCYWSTDGLRYNHFFLQLETDGSYKTKLQGDIGIWGEASGTWTQEAGVVRVSERINKSSIKFPAAFSVQRNHSLKFSYEGAGYSSGGTNLIPSKCDP